MEDEVLHMLLKPGAAANVRISRQEDHVIYRHVGG